MTLKDDELGSKPIGKLMVKMAIPSVIAQLINILYNVVDRIYIGHIPNASAHALTGVGVTFPIIIFVAAFSAFVGAGGAPLSAIWLGKGDKERAEQILGNGVSMLVCFSLFLMMILYLLMEPLLFLFGASHTTISYGKTYRAMISLCVAFSVIVAASFMLFPRFFAGLFTNSAELIELCGENLPLFMTGMLVFGLQMGIQPTFMALGQAKISLFIAVLRKIILLIPLAIILPKFLGPWGIYLSEPISDITSATVATILFLVNIKTILTTDSLEKIR